MSFIFITESRNDLKSDLSWQELTQNTGHYFTPQDVGDDQQLFYIGFTSGTTGIPKGYMRNHRSWLYSFDHSTSVFHIECDDHILSPGPLVHSHFLYAAIQALHIGATVYFVEKFTANKVWNILNRYPITVLYVVPTMVVALLRESNRKSEKLQKIISAGAKLEISLKEKAVQSFPNAEMIEFYGASELSFVSYIKGQASFKKPHSVGISFPGIEISIRDKQGKKVKRGEVGQLFIKSNQIFSGYVNNQEATNEVIHGEWATVGDLGFIDEDNYITIVGRDKNMIISGGLNIYPEEVESVLMEVDGIEEVVVIGVPDEYWGEKVVAMIKWRGSPLQDEELKSFSKRKLSSYKCPREFYHVNSFPYTTSGKIARKKVKDLFRKMIKEVH